MRWLYKGTPVVGLLLLGFSGYVKASPLLRAVVPIDLTLVGAAIVAAAVIFRSLSMGRAGSGGTPIIVLWATFGIGVLGVSRNSYGTSKVFGLYSLTLLCALGGLYLLRSDHARRLWLWLTIAWGALVAYLTIASPDAAVAASSRLAVDGSNTTGSARALGAAIVVLIAFALVCRRRRVLYIVAALALGLLMVRTGARGPLLAAIGAVAVVAIVPAGKGRARRFALGGLAVAAIAFLASQESLAPERVGSVDALTTAGARGELWQQVTAYLLTHPLGIGWGNLGDILSVDAQLKTGFVQYPHNILLEVTSESSWIAGAALVVVVWRALLVQRRHAVDSSVEPAMLGLLVFYVLSAMVAGDVNGNRGVWISVAAAFALGARSIGKSKDSLTVSSDAGLTRSGHSSVSRVTPGTDWRAGLQPGPYATTVSSHDRNSPWGRAINRVGGSS